MRQKTYHILVQDVDEALELIDALSFFTVTNWDTAQVQYTHEGRMSVTVYPGSKAALLQISGTFTTEEMNEIKGV